MLHFCTLLSLYHLLLVVYHDINHTPGYEVEICPFVQLFISFSVLTLGLKVQNIFVEYTCISLPSV